MPIEFPSFDCEAAARLIKRAPFERATDPHPYSAADRYVVERQTQTAYGEYRKLGEKQRAVHAELAQSLTYFHHQQTDVEHGVPAMQARMREFVADAYDRNDAPIDYLREKMHDEAKNQADNGAPAPEANGLCHIVRSIVLTGEAQAQFAEFETARSVYHLCKATRTAMRNALPDRHVRLLKYLAELPEHELQRAEALIGILAPEDSGPGKRKGKIHRGICDRREE